MKKALIKIPLLGNTLIFIFRAKNAFRRLRRPLGYMIKWLYTSNEITNYTYDLDEKNKLFLAALISREFARLMVWSCS